MTGYSESEVRAESTSAFSNVFDYLGRLHLRTFSEALREGVQGLEGGRRARRVKEGGPRICATARIRKGSWERYT